MFATSFPLPHSNGIIPLSLAPTANDDKQESNSGVPFENGGVERNENGAEILVNESDAKDISNQADFDDGTTYPSCDLKLTSINILNDIFYAFLMNIEMVDGYVLLLLTSSWREMIEGGDVVLTFKGSS